LTKELVLEIIARPGGWKALPSLKPPGLITMINGIKRFQDIKQGWGLKNGLMYIH